MAWDRNNRKKKITKNENNSWRNIENGGKYINQLNEGTEIKPHRGSRTQEKRKNSLPSILDFPTMDKSDISNINKRGEHCINDPKHSETDPKDETGLVRMNTESIIYIHFDHFSLLSHSPTMTCRYGHYTCWLLEQRKQHDRDLRVLVAPVSLDLSTWPSSQLRLSRPSSVTSVGALATFSLPISTLCLSLRMMNLLLCFPGRVSVSRSTGTTSWMSWYSQRMMVRVTDLTWFFMMRWHEYSHPQR